MSTFETEKHLVSRSWVTWIVVVAFVLGSIGVIIFESFPLFGLIVGLVGFVSAVFSLVFSNKNWTRFLAVIALIWCTLVVFVCTRSLQPSPDELIQKLTTSVSVNERRVATEKLAEMLDPDIVDRVIELAKTNEQAKEGLIRLREIFKAKLGDNNWETRKKALACLAKIGDKEAIKGIAQNYAFFIKLGREGTESILIDAVNAYGDKTMCIDYLNCGNKKLDRAARQWAERHGYIVYRRPGFPSGPVWGERL